MPLMIAPRPVALSQGRQVLSDMMGSMAGGLNTVSAPDALQPNQFRRGDNGRLTPFGAFIKRGGTQQTAAALVASTAVRNGTAWYKADGSVVTMAVCNGTLYTTTYGAFPLTWTSRAGALSTTVPPSFASFLQAAGTESVYIADGGLLNRYTGTTLTVNIASTPSCTVLAVHNQRLWGCGDAAFPDSIFYSALNDGDSLGIGASAGGQIVVRTFGNQNVLGLVSLANSLMIFHQMGVSRLTGYGQSDVTVAAAGITGDVGTIAPFSIVRVDNIVYFVSDRGLYAANEQQVMPVSTTEQPDPLSVILPLMASTDIANIRAVLNRGTREVEIHIPGYGMYLYHTILKAWAGPWVDGYLSPETSCLFETHNASGYPIVLRGDASGFVSETDRPTIFADNVSAAGIGGTTYVSALQLRRLYCGDPHIAKAWRFGYLLADLAGSSACTVTWTTDSLSDSSVLPASAFALWNGSSWGASLWGTTAQTSYRIPMDGNGYWVDFLITDSSMAQPTFSQAGVRGFALGRR